MKQLGGEVRRASRPRRAVVQLARVTPWRSAMNSRRSLRRHRDGHDSRSGEVVASATGAKSRTGSYGSLLIELRAARERREREEQRVAVGRALGDVVGADDARARRPVLHHEALPQALAQVLRQDAADDVGAAAGREGDDHAHRARGIVLGRRASREKKRRRSRTAAFLMRLPSPRQRLHAFRSSFELAGRGADLFPGLVVHRDAVALALGAVFALRLAGDAHAVEAGRGRRRAQPVEKRAASRARTRRRCRGASGSMTIESMPFSTRRFVRSS